MKVNELQDRGAVDEITLKITKKDEPRDVKGGTLKVCNFSGEDKTGSVTITLWNEDINKVKEGDIIKISKGWSQVYNDTMQISPGKFGTLEIVTEE